MEILNIGPIELIVVLLVMFFLLGPKGMILTAQKIGSWIRGFVRSPMWREIMGYSQEIRELPKKIMDDTGLKEALDDVKQTTKQTATELNSTVNEAMQAARVPEAEHMRISTTAGATASAPVSSDAATAPVKSEVELLAEKVRAANAETAKALLESTSIAKPVTPVAAEAGAEVEGQAETSETPATGEIEPAVDEIQPAADEIQPAVDEVQPVAKRRGRPRKVVPPAGEEPAAVQVPEPVEAETAVVPGDSPAPRIRRPRVKAGAAIESDAGEAQAAAEKFPQTQAVAGVSEPQQEVKRRGRPRKEPTTTVTPDLVLVNADPVVESRQTAVVESPLEEAPAVSKPRGRPRKNTAALLSAEPVPAADLVLAPAIEAPLEEAPAPRKQRGRPRKES